MTMQKRVFRGDVYLADLNPVVGDEQGGKRPVLVIQNDIGNCFSNTTIVAAITRHSYGRSYLPTHVLLNSIPRLFNDSMVLLEQIRTIDKSRLGKKLGRLNQHELGMVDNCLKTSLDLNN